MARTQVERSADTKALLTDAGRKLFGERGYHSVGADEIVTACNLSRGALYHHFDGKRGVFESVVISIHEELTDEIERAAHKAPDLWSGIKAGCAAFVTTCSRPDIRAILLVDALAVLGIERWRQIDTEHGVASLLNGLNECVESGILPKQPVEPLARLINGAVNDAALWLAEKPRSMSRRKEILSALDALLDGLTTPGKRP